LAKTRNVYSCTECGGTSPKWQGQCPQCGAWNTLVESLPQPATQRYRSVAGSTSDVQRLDRVETQAITRVSTGIDELDRVLGGGIVQGAVILLGGDPGIGKSTLLLQSLAALTPSRRTLYVTGEESVDQIGLRAQRLGLDASPLPLLAEIQLERVLATLERLKPEVVVIDSIQTTYTEALTSAPGSVAQVRECAAQLTRYAKQSGTAVILVGHVTKDGAIAGPRVLEHIVDTVLYFEGDTHTSFRLIRAIKNRFGGVNELGVFAMSERGLKGVGNPSAMFLSTQRGEAPGSCAFATVEGTRPLLVEIQALVDPVQGGNPRRLAIGLEAQRLVLLLAILHRHGNIGLADQDVYLNAVGGVRIAEPAADLAATLSIFSSFKNIILDRHLVVFGEIGLAGEIRPVQRGVERLREAAKLGFRQAIIPYLNKPKQPIDGMELIPVKTIAEALEQGDRLALKRY
jgi:DNA repair protein RadA/Sms